jgi:signal peptidase I
MVHIRFVFTSAVVILAGVVGGAARQPVTSQAVLLRGTNNRLVVSMVVAKPGDRVEISNGVVAVNGSRTLIRVQPSGDWSPRVVEPKMYFVAGDPAGVGTDSREWGLVAADRILGTVQIGVLPTP